MIDQKTFNSIREHMLRNYGINLSLAKKNLVENRLFKRLKQYNFDSYDEYHNYIFSIRGKGELALLSDYLSTNKTYFHREPAHFNFINEYLDKVDKNKSISIWSAASSTGDEAYTLSILLNEFNEKNSTRKINYSILGTDISSRVLRIANEAVYTYSHIESLPNPLITKYFQKVIGDNNAPNYRLSDIVRKNVRFKKLNLSKEISSLTQKFDIIFCRNVLIYFDNDNKIRVCNQLINMLKPGGYLILGHCEGFICKSQDVKQMQPAVFQKL